MSVIEHLSRLASNGAALTIEPETEHGPIAVTIHDGSWRKTLSARDVTDFPAALANSFALWEEHRAEVSRVR